MKIKRNVWLLYAISLLQGMVFYGPIATLYRQAAGISIFQITIIESISLGLCIAMELPWGIVSDRIGYKKTLLLCNGFYFVSKIVFWKANGFVAFLLERIMLSVVIAGLSGCDVSMLYLSCNKGDTQMAFSVYSNLGMIGLLVASLTYSGLIKENYRLAGLLTVFSYGCAAIMAFGLKEVRNTPGARTQSIAEAKVLLLNFFNCKRLILFLVGVAFFNETHQTITVFLSQLQYAKSGISPVAMGYIYIFITLIGLIGLASARLTKKLGAKAIASLTYGCATCACLVMAFTSNAGLSVLGIVVLRLAFSLFQPLQIELQNQQVMTQNRATALSINAALIDGVGIFTNIVFGKVAQVNLSASMLFGAGFCAAGLLLFFVWHSKKTITC